MLSLELPAASEREGKRWRPLEMLKRKGTTERLFCAPGPVSGEQVAGLVKGGTTVSSLR